MHASQKGSSTYHDLSVLTALQPCPLLRINQNSARQCLELIARFIEHERLDLPPDQPGEASHRMAVGSPHLPERNETESESDEFMENDPSDDEDYEDYEDDEDYEDYEDYED